MSKLDINEVVVVAWGGGCGIGLEREWVTDESQYISDQEYFRDIVLRAINSHDVDPQDIIDLCKEQIAEKLRTTIERELLQDEKLAHQD